MNEHDRKLAVAIGGRLREARNRAGLSQRQLACPADRVTAAYISRIEAGDRLPSVRALRALAPKLNVTVAWLETGVEDEAEAKIEARVRVEREKQRTAIAALKDARDAIDLALAALGGGR